jgi:hypothetical protein
MKKRKKSTAKLTLGKLLYPPTPCLSDSEHQKQREENAVGSQLTFQYQFHHCTPLLL